MKFKILTVVGTRPNYVKVSGFGTQFSKHLDVFDHRFLHTGQHYDTMLKDIFIQQLGLAGIDYPLSISETLPGAQIGEIMMKMNAVLTEWTPDLVIVVGDVNSTLAAALISNKLNLRLAHVESGLRSFDTSMPEEINRIITDNLADLLFVTEKSGVQNLAREGKRNDQVFFIGNTMIDTLIRYRVAIDESLILDQLKLEKDNYLLVTLHRPSNVDHEISLSEIVNLLIAISHTSRVVFPVHPRTMKKFHEFGLINQLQQAKNLEVMQSQDYFSFQKLIKNSLVVITDSGGIQEETTFYGVPCLTLRKNTERPVTIDLGTNELIDLDVEIIEQKIAAIRNKTNKKGKLPEFWDGKSTERMVNTIKTLFEL